MIDIQGVSKSYAPGNMALHQINLKVDEGKIIYIMGASGSGKSSLLRIIAGLEDADTGSVKVEDEIIKGPSQKLVPGYDYISHVGQKFKLQPYLRVSENIARSIPYFNEADKEDRIRELLAICSLEDKYDEYPPNLSGGEQQRICIALHLAHDPLILLLDEPFSNLDLHQKLILQESLMKIIRSTGTTALIVTHDPQEALAIADEIIILDHGKILQFGTGEEIYQHPVNRKVAELLGPINELKIDGNTFLVRPEKLEIKTAGEYCGTVISSTFQGPYFVLNVDLHKIHGQVILYDRVKHGIGTKIFFSICPLGESDF